MEASTSLEVHVKGVDQNYTRPTPSHEKVAFCITIPNRLFRLWHVEKRTSFKGVINSAMHAKVVKLNEVFLHHSIVPPNCCLEFPQNPCRNHR